MKKGIWLSASIVSLTLLAIGMPIVMPQDLAKVAPQQVKVVLENDRVRVLKLVYEPGEKVALHSHPAVAVIYLTPCKSKFQSTDGELEHDVPAGTVRWSNGTTHTHENTGKTECQVILVELKK
jgi:beta-alanine degradation protein BauB